MRHLLAIDPLTWAKKDGRVGKRTRFNLGDARVRCLSLYQWQLTPENYTHELLLVIGGGDDSRLSTGRATLKGKSASYAEAGLFSWVHLAPASSFV